MYALMRSEHSTCYSRCFADLDIAAKEILSLDQFSTHVMQFHGDYHAGLMSAKEMHYRRGVMENITIRINFTERSSQRKVYADYGL